ncbi:MAG: D-aminoacylase [Acidobacteria bacterium]|nr:D-aminoacylase [Acidobacteriota bacterium]
MHARLAVAALVVGSATLAWQTSTWSQAPAFDIVIRGGHVVDGTGNPWFAADVGITGDTIAAVAPRLDTAGARVVNATGLVVSPGFIDVHTHADAGRTDVAVATADPLVRDDGQDLIGNPSAENNVRQGVTTVIAEPDGFGSVQVGAFLTKVEGSRPAINLGAFVGHGAVRAAVVGQTNRAATPEELERMRQVVRTAMREGAFGLSTGLFYVPGNYAPLQEVVDLARVAAEFGGVHESHMRDEAGGVLNSVRETIAIGEQGGLPTQITHHKLIGKAVWGKSVDTLRLVDEARARGVDATIDQYPYTASNTSIQAGLFPQWAQEGGRAAILARLKDESTRRRIVLAVADAIQNERGGGDPANIVLASCGFDTSLAGKSLAEVLRERGRPVGIEWAADLALEIVEKGGCIAVYHAISEDDLVRIMKHPATMIASDASPGIPVLGKDAPHPRAYGTFARVLGVYVREKHVLTLEDAVRKMSGFPAQRMGLTDRGILRPGMKADVVVFNPATIIDKATFEKPHQYAEGVLDVIVNGHMTMMDGKVTGDRAGRALRLRQ